MRRRDRHRGRGDLLGPAQHGVDPREQLGERERLGDVVVGAEPQRGDLVELVLARRQHDHRDQVVGGAQRGEHLQPVLPGQVDVEQDQPEVLDLGLGQRVEPVARDRGGVAGELEVERQPGGDRVVILDDQDPPDHGAGSSAVMGPVTAARLAPAPQPDPEHGLAGPRLEVELAAVAAHDRGHERQPQAQAGGAAGVGGAAALELLEDPVLLGGVDPGCRCRAPRSRPTARSRPRRSRSACRRRCTSTRWSAG